MSVPRATSAVRAVRRLARRWLPRRLRAEALRLRGALRDRRAGIAFADGRGSQGDFPYAFEGYRLPMLIYPGQERLAEGKRHNQRIMADALDGARVEPGEVLSLWHRVGRPSAVRGYLDGAAIVGGHLTAEAGGGTCLLSTVLYNAGLLAALEVVERHAHSVDVYGEARYFEPGRDATIEYGVLDLRFRNPHAWPVLLEISSDDTEVHAAFRAPRSDLPAVAIEVEQPEREDGFLSARLLRRVTPPGRDPRVEDLGWSRYGIADGSPRDAPGESQSAALGVSRG